LCSGATPGSVVDDVCLLQKQVEMLGHSDLDNEDAAPPVQLAQNNVGQAAVSYSGSAFLAQPAAKPPVSIQSTQPQAVLSSRDPFLDDEDADLFNVPGPSYAKDLLGTSSSVPQPQQEEQHAQFLDEEREQWEAEQEAEQQSQLEAEKEAEQQAKKRAEQLVQLTLPQQAQQELPAETLQIAPHMEDLPAVQVSQTAQSFNFGDPKIEDAQARMFFEEQGNLGGKIDASPKQDTVFDDKLLPRMSSEAFDDVILPPVVSAMEQPKKLSFAQVSSGLASTATSQLSKGHSEAGSFRAPGSPPTTGQTGETGELYGTFLDPNLMRLAFPQKSEAELHAERRIYQEQDKIAHVQQNAAEAFGKLKAEVYHSADETLLREQETAKLDTALRRAELLTDANQYRAQVVHDSRLDVQNTASLERAAHIATQSAQQERELREAAESRAPQDEEARIAAVSRASAEETLSVQRAQAEAERVRSIERKTLEGMTQDSLGSGNAAADVVTSYHNFDQALNDANSEAAHRTADLQNWFGIVSHVAETPNAGLSFPSALPTTQFSMPENSQMTPTSSQQVLGRTISPITIPVEGTNTGVSMSMTSAEMQNGQERSTKLALTATDSALGGLADARPSVGSSSVNTMSSCQPGSAVWPSCASSGFTHGPEHSACTPQCTWQCDTPQCDQVCEPQCQPPRCETRCIGLDTSGCVMECDEPHCAVACNGNQCPSGGCASCQATCSEPMCKLRCPNTQPCRNICEEPSCEWHCRAPDECPAPQCHMVCEAPPQCLGSTYQQLPPLAPGETSVQSFVAPPGLSETTGATMQPSPTSVQVPMMSNMEQGGAAASEFQRHTLVTMPVISAATSGR